MKQARTAERCSGETVLRLLRNDMVCHYLISSLFFSHLGLASLLVEYKPILDEVEKILAEAGLDEEEIKRSGAAGGAKGPQRERGR